MGNVKQFTIGNTTYNAARATAIQQDEVLSLLTAALIQRLALAGQNGIDADESVIFAMTLAMPFALKQKIDSLLMSRITRHGETNPVSVADFDGRIMDYNRLRAQVLMWNLSGFFTYWANERNAAIAAMQDQDSTETA